jgi:hypothetical protein
MIQNPVRYLVLLLLLAWPITACVGEMARAETPARYGEPVRYATGVPLVYPDFRVQYVARSEIASEVYPRGFVFHNFLVISATGTQTVSWSSGTGDIGPQPFTVDGVTYLLELQRSDKLGPLSENTLVIWREESK